MTMEQRVAKGAELLDNVRPGWYEDVDVDILEFPDPCSCVLGQLYGDVQQGYDVLALSQHWNKKIVGNPFFDQTVMFGFNTAGITDPGVPYEVNRWDRLTELWKNQILARRFPAVTPSV